MIVPSAPPNDRAGLSILREVVDAFGVANGLRGLKGMPLVIPIVDAEVLEANGLADDVEGPAPQGSAEVRELNDGRAVS